MLFSNHDFSKVVVTTDDIYVQINLPEFIFCLFPFPKRIFGPKVLWARRVGPIINSIVCC
jgi:hypothetical protein